MPEDIIVSYSELDTFRQCPLKHRWSYVERWTKPPREAGPLDIGSLWHVVLETHYKVLKATQAKRGQLQTIGPQDRLERAWKLIRPKLRNSNGAPQTETQEIVEWMYRGHLEAYGLDDDFRILGVEDRRQFRLNDLQGRPSRFILKIRADLVVYQKSTGLRWIIDHKSCSSLPHDYELDLDDQFGLYEFGYVATGVKIDGTIHDAARTKKLKTRELSIDERFARTPMRRVPAELQQIARDAYLAARAAYSADNLEAPYSSPDVRQCGWKCDFKEIHLHDRKGVPAATLLPDYGFHQDFTRH